MILRLLCLALLSISAMAGDFLSDWPVGKTEKISYDMTMLIPTEMKGIVTAEITRVAQPEPMFVINQIYDIPSQEVKVITSEKYRVSDMRILFSENYFKLGPQIKAQIGTDSIVITAKAVGDSLEITSNSPLAPAGKVAIIPGLTTTTGAILTSRNFAFKLAAVRKYSQMNFLAFTGKPFLPENVADSVIGEDSASVPAGNFKCFKVLKSANGQAINAYYNKEKNHLPVMLEVVNPTTGMTSARVVLTKYE
jgi:hypothetical protein